MKLQRPRCRDVCKRVSGRQRLKTRRILFTFVFINEILVGDTTCRKFLLFMFSSFFFFFFNLDSWPFFKQASFLPLPSLRRKDRGSLGFEKVEKVRFRKRKRKTGWTFPPFRDVVGKKTIQKYSYVCVRRTLLYTIINRKLIVDFHADYWMTVIRFLFPFSLSHCLSLSLSLFLDFLLHAI